MPISHGDESDSDLAGGRAVAVGCTPCFGECTSQIQPSRYFKRATSKSTSIAVYCAALESRSTFRQKNSTCWRT